MLSDMNYISFLKVSNKVSDSKLGMQKGGQTIRLSSESFGEVEEGITRSGGKRTAIGVPMHELMHALGTLKF